MAIAPAGKVIVLKEVGETTPFGPVNIPALLATIRNTFRNSTKPADTVVGAVPALDVVDQAFQEMGID